MMTQKFIAVCKFIFVVFVMILRASDIASAEDKMVLLCDDRPPFHFINVEGKIDGYAANTVQCTLEKMGQPYEIKIVPWKRAQVETQRGNADSFFAASQNTTRDEYAQISEIIIDQHWSWLMLETSSFDPTSETFKKDARTGSWLGSNSLDWLKSNNYNIQASPEIAEQLVKQLLSGRIDVAFASDVILNEIVEKMGVQDKVKMVKHAHKPWGVYISNKFLEKHTGFMDKFNAAIKGCLR